MPLRPLRTLTAGLLALAIAGLGALSFQRKVESFQPLGFLAQREGGGWRVLAVSDTTSALQAGDHILLIGGEAASGIDLGARLRGAPQSALTVLRGGAPAAVAYRPPPLALDYAYLLLAVLAAGYLLIGIYTLLKDSRRPAWLFYLWCLVSAGLYLISPAGDLDSLYRTTYFADLAARLALGPLTLHLFLRFPAPLRSRSGSLRSTAFLYLPAAVLLFLESDLAFFGGRIAFGAASAAAVAALDRLELAHLAGFALAAAAVLTRRLRRTRDLAQRRQVAWIAVGMAGGYVPFVVLYVLPRLVGLDFPPLVQVLTVAPLAAVPVAFAYAILRYRLWDIGVLVRNTATLTLTALLGICGFSLASAIVDRVVPADFSRARNLLAFGSGLAIAGVLIPTRRRIGASLERLHYGTAFSRRQALLEFGRRLVEERDLDRLCRSLIEQLQAALDLERANLYLLHGDCLVPVEPHAGLPATLAPDGFGAAFWERDVAPLSGAALPPLAPAPGDQLFALGYRYAFPLRVRRARVGIALASYRRDQVPLSCDDTDLIRNLLHQAALGIENAQLLDRVQQQLGEVSRLQRFSETIIESSPAGIAVVDPAGAVVSCNLGFAHLVGAERARLIGRPLREALPAVDLPPAGEGITETSFEARDGERRHLQVSRAPFAAGQGDELEVLVVQDVSGRVAMENALREKERLAALGMLAAGVAHEVNTPITGISSYAQMLLADLPEGDPRREVLKKMERQTFRAARIVNNLLDFARERASELSAVPVAAVMGECLDLLRERLAEGRIEVIWEPPASHPYVLGNEGELQQVFTNLLVNALDAMAAHGGHLRVRVEEQPDRVRVHVADEGPGMAADELERIFQPFYSTKLGRGGTGLGLAISRSIVRHHQGDLRVESTPGAGSRFTVELPRHPAPPAGA